MAAKLFIFDVDGVLLDLWATMKGVYEEFTSQKLSQSQWDAVIADYLRDPVPYRQFGEYFDNSDAMGALSAVDGMPELVRKLKLLDFDLMIITSVTDREDITCKRESNLSRIFGDVFDRIIYTGRGSSKAAALEEAAKGYHVSFSAMIIRKRGRRTRYCHLPVVVCQSASTADLGKNRPGRDCGDSFGRRNF